MDGNEARVCTICRPILERLDKARKARLELQNIKIMVKQQPSSPNEENDEQPMTNNWLVNDIETKKDILEEFVSESSKPIIKASSDENEIKACKVSVSMELFHEHKSVT